MTYTEKLKDPEWQKLRLVIFNRDNFLCVKCGRGDLMLCVHHLYYIPKREPWEYPGGAYQTLCVECHDKEKLRSDPNSGMGPYPDWEQALSYLMIHVGEEKLNRLMWELIAASADISPLEPSSVFDRILKEIPKMRKIEFLKNLEAA